MQGVVDFSQWIEEVPVDYDVYLSKDSDPDSFKQIHLYRVLWYVILPLDSLPFTHVH